MKRDLFLLVGQSNMAGRGVLPDNKEQPDERIVAWGPEKQWIAAQDPLHYDIPRLIGVGPGLAFAKTVLDHGASASIGLIPCAVGGTKIERWIEGGDLFENAMEQALLAMRDGELKAILWHQGESDSMEEADALQYEQRFRSMIPSMRTRLGRPDIPFIAGKLGTFLNPERYPFADRIGQIVENAGEAIGRYGWVDSDGLTDKGDILHFDTPSAQQLGRRYAQRYLSLIQS